MPDVHEIDAEFTSTHGVVKFRNDDRKYLLIADRKAKSNAKSLREAANIILSHPGDRAEAIAEWLGDLATKFEQCQPVQNAAEDAVPTDYHWSNDDIDHFSGDKT